MPVISRCDVSENLWKTLVVKLFIEEAMVSSEKEHVRKSRPVNKYDLISIRMSHCHFVSCIRMAIE